MDRNRTDFEAWAREELSFVDHDFRLGFVEPPEYASYDTHLIHKGWQASRKQALEEAAEEVDSFAVAYMEQANGGDNSGASDHKADAAEQIADAIRSLEGNATKETT